MHEDCDQVDGRDPDVVGHTTLQHVGQVDDLHLDRGDDIVEEPLRVLGLIHEESVVGAHDPVLNGYPQAGVLGCVLIFVCFPIIRVAVFRLVIP